MANISGKTKEGHGHGMATTWKHLFFLTQKNMSTKKRCKTQQKPKPNFVLRFVQMKFFGFQKKIGIRGWKQLPPLPKDKTSLSPAWGWWKVWPTVWL